MKTLIALDFDGCVSPIDRNKDFTQDPEFTVLKLGGFMCAIRKETINFLNIINKIENATVVWVSSWQENTEGLHQESKKSIPHFSWVKTSIGKAEATINYAVSNEYQKIVFVEDNLKESNKLKSLIKKWNLSNDTIDILAIRPKITVGLTSQHIQKIKNFI